MAGNRDLHGNVPDDAVAALLLIDVVTDLEFDGGDVLLEQALPMAHAIRELKATCAARGIPSVYVNDNFGRWRSDFRSQVRHCLEDGVRGEPLARLLHPDDEDYFVLKPKHSGFFGTTLALLLEHLGARTLIIAGLAGDICVLFTAADAYMRGYRLAVPADCIACERRELHERAVAQLARIGADVRPWRSLDLDALGAVSATSR